MRPAPSARLATTAGGAERRSPAQPARVDVDAVTGVRSRPPKEERDRRQRQHGEDGRRAATSTRSREPSPALPAGETPRLRLGLREAAQVFDFRAAHRAGRRVRMLHAFVDEQRRALRRRDGRPARAPRGPSWRRRLHLAHRAHLPRCSATSATTGRRGDARETPEGLGIGMPVHRLVFPLFMKMRDRAADYRRAETAAAVPADPGPIFSD